MFGEGFWEDYRLITECVAAEKSTYAVAEKKAGIAQNRDTINGTINLNERQKWFLLKLKDDRNITAEDIVRRFDVSLSTVRRDIAELKERGWIKFHGSRKTGHYEIIEP